MSLVVEEIGILAADRRREEPFTVIRPPRSDTVTRSASGAPARPQTPASDTSRTTGHRQMLAAAMQRGTIRG